MKIDVHTHILPKTIPDFKHKFGYGGFISNPDLKSPSNEISLYKDDGSFFRKVNYNCFDLKTRLDENLHSKVDVQVLSTVPVMFSYFAKPKDAQYVSQFLNDDLADSISLFDKNFIGLGTLPMQDINLAVKELERCIKVLKFKGVEIGSHINEFNLDNPIFYPIYQALCDLDAVLFIHPWDMHGQKQMPKYFLPWLVGMPMELSLAISSMVFGGIFEKFPKLKVYFAHGGGSFSFTLGRIDHAYHVRPDLCAINIKSRPSDYLKHIFVDSLVHSNEALEFIVNTFGSDQIMLGTDYPFVLGENKPGALVEQNTTLTQTQKTNIHHNVAKKFFDLNNGNN